MHSWTFGCVFPKVHLFLRIWNYLFMNCFFLFVGLVHYCIKRHFVFFFHSFLRNQFLNQRVAVSKKKTSYGILAQPNKLDSWDYSKCLFFSKWNFVQQTVDKMKTLRARQQNGKFDMNNCFVGLDTRKKSTSTTIFGWSPRKSTIEKCHNNQMPQKYWAQKKLVFTSVCSSKNCTNKIQRGKDSAKIPKFLFFGKNQTVSRCTKNKTKLVHKHQKPSLLQNVFFTVKISPFESNKKKKKTNSAKNFRYLHRNAEDLFFWTITKTFSLGKRKEVRS